MHNKLIVLLDRYTWKEEKLKKGDSLKVISKKSKKTKRILTYKTSLQARHAVTKWLYDQGFVDQKHFSNGPADWFVIGGRWSGDFVRRMLHPLLWQACEEKLWELKDETGINRLGLNETKKQRENAYKIFHDFFPKFKGTIPIAKDSYKQLGDKDDAVLVTEKIWERILKEPIKVCGDDPYQDQVVHVEGVVSINCKKSKVVGKMWAVLIDYHS